MCNECYFAASSVARRSEDDLRCGYGLVHLHFFDQLHVQIC